MGMLDLSPDALSTAQDSLRGFSQTKVVERIFANEDDVAYAPRGGTAAGKEQTKQRKTNRMPDQDMYQRHVERTTQRKTHRVPGQDMYHNKKNYTFNGRPFLTFPVGPNVDRFTRFVVGIVAAASLLVALIALPKIKEREYTILATCLFVLPFSSMISMIGKQSTTEVMVGVATYAAVLVVFVGQTIAAPD